MTAMLSVCLRDIPMSEEDYQYCAGAAEERGKTWAEFACEALIAYAAA